MDGIQRAYPFRFGISRRAVGVGSSCKVRADVTTRGALLTEIERSRAADTGFHPADLLHAPARQHAGGVVHLGDQHDLPARRGALEPRGVRRQLLLHRRHGPLRGADRDRRRHDRPPRLLPARHGDAGRHHLALRLPLGDRGPVLGLGGGLDAARPGVHVLLRSGRGLAGRRPERDPFRGQPGVGLRPRTGRRRRGDVDGVGCRRLHRPGHEPRRAVRVARRRAPGDVRAGVRPDEGRRLHADGEHRGHEEVCSGSQAPRSSTAGGCRR